MHIDCMVFEVAESEFDIGLTIKRNPIAFNCHLILNIRVKNLK